MSEWNIQGETATRQAGGGGNTALPHQAVGMTRPERRPIGPVLRQRDPASLPVGERLNCGTTPGASPSKHGDYRRRTTPTLLCVTAAVAALAVLACAVVAQPTPEPTTPAPTEAPPKTLAPATDVGEKPSTQSSTHPTPATSTEIAPFLQTDDRTAEPEPFRSGLSNRERDCLPDKAHTPASTLRMLETGEAHLSGIMGCLTDENQFALFLALNHADLAGLSRESQHCMWRGHRPLVFMTQQAPARDEDAFAGRMTAALIAPGAITAHCLTDAEFEALDDPAKPNPRQRDINACLVQQAGGIEEFVQWLLEEQNSTAAPPGYEQCAQQAPTP